MRAGVDLGGTKIDVLIVEGERDVHGRLRRPTPTEGGAAAIVDAIARTVQEAADAAAVDVGRLTGVGVGSPGAVDTAAGTVGFNSNLAGGWHDPSPLADELARLTGTRVAVANDVDVAASAELELGAGRELPSFLAVWWGTGVGGSVVLAGRRWEGNGGAGELGHMVVKLRGRRCPCGRRGCVEAYAGRAAMEARARQLHDRGQPTKLFDLMRKANRDRLTSGVWERAPLGNDRLGANRPARACESHGPRRGAPVGGGGEGGWGGGWGGGAGGGGRTASGRRCARTSPPRPATRRFDPQSSATTAVRSEPRCSSDRADREPAVRTLRLARDGQEAARKGGCSLCAARRDRSSAHDGSRGSSERVSGEAGRPDRPSSVPPRKEQRLSPLLSRRGQIHARQA